MSASGSPSSAASSSGKPPVSVGQVFAFVAGFVALAAIGAAIGWWMTDSPTPQTVASSSTPATPTTVPSSPPTVPSTTPTQSATGTTIPDFSAAGVTFSDARDKLREQGLGVVLYFNDGGNGALVDHTVPAAGTVVKRGTTVKIYVTGPAPLLQIPDVSGERCGQGGKDLAAAGLIPSYPEGKEGNVMWTDPSAADTQTHWNDPIQLHCGTGPIGQPSGDPTDGSPGDGQPSASATP